MEHQIKAVVFDCQGPIEILTFLDNLKSTCGDHNVEKWEALNLLLFLLKGSIEAALTHRIDTDATST